MKPKDEPDLQQQIADAQNGDQDALSTVIRAVQDMVHHLAMRILVDPEDARDATQEILIKLTTSLSRFRGESAFRTWVYRVAVNYLLNAKKVRDRDPGLTFAAFEADLENGLAPDTARSAEDSVLLNELRISCTMAMLLCLDVRHRVCYVLGDVLELDHTEAATILDISRDNFRKRLSRARREVLAFTSRACGIANENAKCTCPRRLPAAQQLGRVDPSRLVHATRDAPSYEKALRQARALEGKLKVLSLQRATPEYSSPEDFGRLITRLVSGTG